MLVFIAVVFSFLLFTRVNTIYFLDFVANHDLVWGSLLPLFRHGSRIVISTFQNVLYWLALAHDEDSDDEVVVICRDDDFPF